MKKTLVVSMLLAGVQSATVLAVGAAQFKSRVYFVIHESSPYRVQRGRKVIEQEFAETYETMPVLAGHPYQVVSDGNQVAFSMVADADMRDPFQNVVAQIVGHLNGSVNTRGGYDLLRMPTDENPDRYLEVALDETNTKIRSIVARSITLRDVLAELKLQFGEEPAPPPTTRLSALAKRLRAAATKEISRRFSYIVPGDCAAQPIDWSFGVRPAPAPGAPAAIAEVAAKEPPAKTLDEAITELAKVFRLSVENHQGTYLFSGNCPHPTAPRRSTGTLEFLPSRWIQLGEPAPPPPMMMAPAPRPIEAPSAPMVQVRMTE